MSVKFYMLYCEICGWKKHTDGSDVGDIYQVKRSPIPGGVPYLDEQNKTVTPKSHKQPKIFRCQKCGRPCKARKLSGKDPTFDPLSTQRTDDFKDRFTGRENSTEGHPLS